jgi:hypothetical protein
MMLQKTAAALKDETFVIIFDHREGGKRYYLWGHFPLLMTRRIS